MFEALLLEHVQDRWVLVRVLDLVPTIVEAGVRAFGCSGERGLESEVPCGVVDVAPTILHLMGVDGAADMDGRVLNEFLERGPHPGDVAIRWEEKTAQRSLGTRGVRQKVCYSLAAGHRYLDSVRIVPD